MRYFNGVVPGGALAHGGLFMAGSGNILDAYWTLGGVKVGASLPVTYELTEIRMDTLVSEVHMQLQLGDMFFDDALNTDLVAGWTNIRTFVSIPAAELDLPDINRTLNEALYAGFQVTPFLGQPGLPGSTGVPILPTDTFLYGDFPPDSFFDVFLGEILPAFQGPDYESLLIADVIVAPVNDPTNFTVVGEFWNLNPQSPEPATMGLLAIGGVAVLRRRRRR
ncbi:MAG: PEP-CTERM sorting domain-containing protein [Planctomycetota bacterium]